MTRETSFTSGTYFTPLHGYHGTEKTETGKLDGHFSEHLKHKEFACILKTGFNTGNFPPIRENVEVIKIEVDQPGSGGMCQ